MAVAAKKKPAPKEVTVLEELLTACGEEAQAEGESKTDFVERLVKALNEISEDDYNGLSKEGRAWLDDAVVKYNDNQLDDVETLEGMVEDEPEPPKAKPKLKAKSKEPEAEDDPEPPKSTRPKAKAKEPEPEEEEAEAPKSTRPKAKAKDADDEEAPKAKKNPADNLPKRAGHSAEFRKIVCDNWGKKDVNGMVAIGKKRQLTIVESQMRTVYNQTAPVLAYLEEQGRLSEA